MRYVPNLIPEKSKILPDYFKGNLYHHKKKQPLRDLLMWIAGIFFFLSALAFVAHPLLLLLFALIGFILIPPGHRFLERKLRFRLTTKIKTFATAILFIASIPLSVHYSEIDSRNAYQQKLIDEKVAKEKTLADQKEKQRKDSLNFYILKSNQLIGQQDIDAAGKNLEFAMSFTATESEKGEVAKQMTGISAIRTFDLVKSGKYEKALPELVELMYADPDNAEIRYNVALCYSKTGDVQEAVNILKPLVEANHPTAEELHDKINPVRKKIIGYETLCCDGTTSNARGRGACSHHGGVCDWNHPIYEESRKY